MIAPVNEASEAWGYVLDYLTEDLLNTENEAILEEIAEDGEQLDALVAQVRSALEAASAKAEASTVAASGQDAANVWCHLPGVLGAAIDVFLYPAVLLWKALAVLNKRHMVDGAFVLAIIYGIFFVSLQRDFGVVKHVQALVDSERITIAAANQFDSAAGRHSPQPAIVDRNPATSNRSARLATSTGIVEPWIDRSDVTGSISGTNAGSAKILLGSLRRHQAAAVGALSKAPREGTSSADVTSAKAVKAWSVLSQVLFPTSAAANTPALVTTIAIYNSNDDQFEMVMCNNRRITAPTELVEKIAFVSDEVGMSRGKSDVACRIIPSTQWRASTISLEKAFVAHADDDAAATRALGSGEAGFKAREK